MEKNRIKQDNKTHYLDLIEKTWPSLVSYLSYAFTLATLYINIIIISNIIWPNESFHSSEIGLLFGISTYMMAFSGLAFGNLADKFSRIKLLSVTVVFFGMGFIINGFAPAEMGIYTYLYFLICVLIRGFFSGGFWPIINSYITDKTDEDERSQYFGILNSTFQIIDLIGMIFAAFMFQSGLWKLYFWIVGSFISFLGIIILKANEPKRASTREELKDVISYEKVLYEFRLNKSSIKETIVKPTNIIAFIEGIFSSVLLSIPDFLLIAYFESEPHNFSPIVASIFMIMFGVPGTIFGSLLFSKLSDNLAKKNIKNRVYLIIFSLVGIFLIFLIVFSLPIPHFTVQEGNDLILILSFPIIWVLGFIAFLSRSILGLYSINQPPLLQKINLPEAQGFISSANQFLESIGYGTGPILAGIFLSLFNQNYQITVTLTMSLGILGAFFWIIAVKWIDEDSNRISKILQKRREDLKKKI
jgi:MFS family permease